MITVRRCPRVAGVVMILASLSGAGDAPRVDTNSKRAVAPPTSESRLAQSPNGLGMRRPYERGKVPVIFIHGLWGFPHLWEPMIEDLEAEPLLRRRYQFWTFSYASGDPIPYSAHMLRQSVRQARRLFDPDGTDAAFDQMVLVGHSLGGILAKIEPPVPGAGDGIVPYSSSHLESADSEVLFHGHHICLSSPAVIGEARRILREHAGIDPTSRTEHRDIAREDPESHRERRPGAVRLERSLP